MNEHLEETLNKFLIKALNGLDSAGDFLAGEIPEVVEQLLLMHLYTNITEFLLVNLFTVLFIIVGINAFKKGVKIKEESKEAKYLYGDEGLQLCMYVIFWIFLFTLFPLNITAYTSCLTESIKIIFAPKAWLLEYAANLVK